MIKKYPYLKNIDFLNKIYGQHNKTSYVLITVLDWAERPLQEIQGRVTSASISVNGDSSVRRTASLTMKILDDSELYTNVDSLLGINKKIYLETGLSNNFAHLGSRYYSDYPIIWFPFGVFIIQNYSINHDASGVTVNLSLGDKMCLLNGDAGGVIPASVNFESVDTLGPDGDLHSEWIRINQLIPEMVNHFGGEDLNKIIVNDIDDKIKQVLKWRGSNNLYLFIQKTDEKNCKYTTINAPKDINNDAFRKITIPFNYDAGYTYTDFVYPGELTAGAGDSVCTVLDKIKNTLGNYEYYYDVFGNFIFQEIKNYVNTSEWRTIYQSLVENPGDYLPYAYNAGLSTSTYSFDSTDFVISYSNAPQFNMIKNDFIVWGIRTSSTGQQLPCRYHLAIDKRPKITEPYVNSLPICFDVSMYDKIKRCYIIKGQYNSLNELKAANPQGIVGEYYQVTGGGVNEDEAGIYTWINDIDNYNNLLLNYFESIEENDIEFSVNDTDTSKTIKSGYLKMPIASTKIYTTGAFSIPVTTDWRNVLYFYGLFANSSGIDAEYYWAELCNEWPKIYDVEADQYYDGVLDMPTNLDWWLDLIDNSAILNKFSVSTIGRRSYAKTESGCNCVFEPDIPDIVMVDTQTELDKDTRTEKTKQELRELGLIPIQVDPSIYSSLAEGGTFNSCYQNVRQLITNYTDYNETINVTCLPIYHLEPNTRVTFNDPDSGIYGDYIINTISFNLGNGGTMSISAKKCIEKI